MVRLFRFTSEGWGPLTVFLQWPIKYEFYQKEKITVKTDTVIDAVREDLHRRSQLGIAKYGTTLGENQSSLRDRLQHAYEECLDMANYLKWSIMQIDEPSEVTHCRHGRSLGNPDVCPKCQAEMDQDAQLERLEKQFAIGKDGKPISIDDECVWEDPNPKNTPIKVVKLINITSAGRPVVSEHGDDPGRETDWSRLRKNGNA